jgi:hypothetical protein
MGKLPRVFPAISGSSRSVFAEIASAPSHAALYGGRSGNRWPNLVVAVSELRHSAMLRPRAPDTPPIPRRMPKLRIIVMGGTSDQVMFD